MTSASTFERRKQHLFLFLCGIFMTNAIIAEIIGVKIFSVESTLGLPPAQIGLLGNVLDFNMSAGVINWPVVFVTSDLINEYFGKRGVRRISFLTAGFICYMFLVVYVATLLPSAQFWIDINGQDGFNISDAFNKIFRQGLGIMVGSIAAFLMAQLLDVSIFAWLRQRTGGRYLWVRATVSTLCSQLIDSYVVITIAFYVFGDWTLTQILATGFVGYLYKAAVAVLVTPLLYVIHGMIDRYLGKENADRMTEEAVNSN